MKKLIAVLGLITTANAANFTVIDSGEVSIKNGYPKILLTTVCIDGTEYIITSKDGYSVYGNTLVALDKDGKPIQCKAKN